MQRADALALLILPLAVSTLLTAAAAARAGEAATTITIESDPTGARVCERRSGSVVCFERTPCRIPVTGARTRKYYLRKLGYDPVTLSVKKGHRQARARLNERELFERASGANEQVRAVRGAASQILSDHIHGPAADFGESKFDLLGGMAVLALADGNYLSVGILLDDEFRRTELRSVRRIRNRRSRQQELVRATLGYAGGSFLRQLAQALAGVDGLDGIVLSMRFTATKAILVEDMDRFTKHKVWQWEQGGSVYQKHLVYTQDVAETDVLDVRDLRQVVVKARSADILEQTNPCCESLIAAAEIHLDDNRTGTMEPLAR